MCRDLSYLCSQIYLFFKSLETYPRALHNKMYAAYSLGPHYWWRFSIRMRRLNDYWITVVTPGNTGEPNSVSFQTAYGWWIVQRLPYTYLSAAPYASTTWFNKASTFLLHKNKWYSGYQTFESRSYKDYFMMTRGYSVYMYNIHEGNYHMKDYCSWTMSEPCKFYCFTVSV